MAFYIRSPGPHLRNSDMPCGAVAFTAQVGEGETVKETIVVVGVLRWATKPRAVGNREHHWHNLDSLVDTPSCGIRHFLEELCLVRQQSLPS